MSGPNFPEMLIQEFREITLDRTNVQKLEQGRMAWVDHARGIAIMLVVYRHVIVGMRRSGVEVSSVMYNIQEVFYNFRMPVFFVLSGIFIAGRLKKKTEGFIIKDRAATVLYPYILWGMITILLQIVFSSYANSKREWSDLFNILLQPRDVDHLWYLLALFNTSVIYLLVSMLTKKIWVHALIAIALYVISAQPGIEQYSLIYDTCFFYVYFFAGILISPFLLDKQMRSQILNPKHLFWLIPLCVIGQFYWFSQWSLGITAYRSIEKEFFPIFFAINMVACYIIYVLSALIAKWQRNDWLAFIGKHSLYIYILHVFVAAITRNLLLHTNIDINSWIFMSICWTAGLTVPIAFYKTFKGFGFGFLFSLKQSKSK